MFNLLNKVLDTVNIVRELANKGLEDFCKFFGHTIGDSSTTKHYRPEVSVWFVDLREAIKLGGTQPVEYRDL